MLSKVPGGGEKGPIFCVNSEAHVRRNGDSGSEKIGVRGQVLIFAVMSAIRIDNTVH